MHWKVQYESKKSNIRFKVPKIFKTKLFKFFKVIRSINNIRSLNYSIVVSEFNKEFKVPFFHRLVHVVDKHN